MERCFLLLVLFGFSWAVAAQEKRPTEKPKMQYMGAYDAGQAGVSIYKLFDPTEDVVCYLMTPESVSRKAVEGGKWLYDANSIGSISCVKVRMAVVPVSPQGPKK
jgi:hypothetical protein